MCVLERAPAHIQICVFDWQATGACLNYPPTPFPPLSCYSSHSEILPSGQAEADGSASGPGPGLDKIALEGVVVQRAECRPAVSENYMRLKKLQIEASSKPMRLSQQLDKAVTTNYKPVANHANNLEYEKKKKEEGKRARADRQQVLDMLFSAFEKHQFYNIKDLVDITKQPVIYLKEILRDIGIYNVKGTHKNTWELKPEYRHYQGEEKSE